MKMRKISVGEMYMYRGYMLNIDTNEVDLERNCEVWEKLW